MDSICSICKATLDTENAAILTMSGYGTPRYICDGCEGDISAATGAREISVISSAMDRIGKKMTENNPDDSAVLKSVEEIMTEARLRAEKIKSGEYDFDEEAEIAEQESGEEIPEELLETEEDRELDRKEREKNKKIDRITNVVCMVLLLAAFGFLAYKIISRFL